MFLLSTDRYIRLHGVTFLLWEAQISIFDISLCASGLGLSPLVTAAISGLLYKPQMIDEDDCGAIGGMKIDRGNRSTQRKPASAPLCPPQIPHGQTRARTRASAVGSQRLTAWAMARPSLCTNWLTDSKKESFWEVDIPSAF
jgi:hypothetical protein